MKNLLYFCSRFQKLTNMVIKREMAILLILIGYLSLGIGYLNVVNQETERLKKETEVLVSQIVDDLEEIYLQQQKKR